MMKLFTISDNSVTLHNLAVEAMTALLILLWVYTASSKLMDYSIFQFQIQLQPLPQWLNWLLGWLLPPAELVLAGLLAFKRMRHLGLLLTFAALLLFSAYILWLLITQDHIPCACGGPINGFTWWQHLLFNLFFASIALCTMALIKSNKKTYYG